MKIFNLTLAMLLFLSHTAYAKVDLVSLPEREGVQLTIYNSADLTLARELRNLTLRDGFNKLQFSWVNTLIDPTSLDLNPTAYRENIDVFDLTFPPRVKDLGLWNIKSGVSGDVPVEISYLTSGLSWHAFYEGTLNEDETEMELKGYVRVTNNSGEDYENAKVRLIVGKVNMVDQIYSLANREYPFGLPGFWPTDREDDGYARRAKKEIQKASSLAFGMVADAAVMEEVASPKQIIKQGLSEYFLYSIEGRETIPHGFSKRLPSFTSEKVPVENLYKFEEERYGKQVLRFLSFKNDEEHELGETPIPGGDIRVFRRVNAQKNLSYEGRSNFKYIPVEEDVELNMGATQTVLVEPKLMKFKTDNYRYDRKQNINGWDEIMNYTIELNNTRAVPARIEITRNFHTSNWEIKSAGDYGLYEKIDNDSVRYTVELKPNEKKGINYILTTFHGTRAERR